MRDEIDANNGTNPVGVSGILSNQSQRKCIDFYNFSRTKSYKVFNLIHTRLNYAQIPRYYVKFGENIIIEKYSYTVKNR